MEPSYRKKTTCLALQKSKKTNLKALKSTKIKNKVFNKD
jgi:hypothetical protein